MASRKPNNLPTGWGGAPVAAPSIEAIRDAAAWLRGRIVHTPLVELRGADEHGDIYLKPETLQPIGSFKIRGALNWARHLSAEQRARGLSTCSAGNTAQAPVLKPSVRVVAVQTEASPAPQACFEQGRPVWVESRPTICEGAAVPVIVDEMFPLLRQVIDEVVVVSEDAARAAIRRLALDNKLVVEGAGAVSVAAALSMRRSQRGRSICILSGGSISAERLIAAIG